MRYPKDLVISQVTSKTTLEPFTAPALTQTTQNAQQNQGEGEGEGEDQQQQQGDEEENQGEQQTTGTQNPTTPPQQTEEVTYGYLKVLLAPGTTTKEGKSLKFIALPLNETVFPQLKGLREKYTIMSKTICNGKNTEKCITKEENKWLLPVMIPETLDGDAKTGEPKQPTHKPTTTPPVETKKMEGRWPYTNLFALEAEFTNLESMKNQLMNTKKFPYDKHLDEDSGCFSFPFSLWTYSTRGDITLLWVFLQRAYLLQMYRYVA